MVGLFGAGAVLNYAFGVVLAWLLVPAEFGTVGAVQNVLLLAAGLLIAGLPWALTRHIAKNYRNPEATKPEFRTALVANFGFGLLLGAAFMAAQLSGLQLVPTRSLLLDAAVTAEISVVALKSILAGAAMGGRRFGGVAAMDGADIVIKCTVAVFLVTVLHAGPAGVALGFLFGALGSVLIGVRTNKGLLPGRGPLAKPGFLTTSTAFWFASSSMTFLITADLLGLEVIGKAAGVTAAALAGYQACAMLARASFYLSSAIGEAVFPFIARSETRQEKHYWFMAAARWIPLLIIPIQVGLILAPGPVLRLFLPQHYSTAQTLLRVLAAGTLGALMTNTLMLSLLAIGYGRQVGWRMCVTAAAEMTGLAILVPGYGARGAAYSYLISGCLGVALLAPLYLKALQVRLPTPQWLALYSAGLAPTAAAFFLAARSPTPLAWPLILTGSCLFLLPARRMRLITDADMKTMQLLRTRLRQDWRRAPDRVIASHTSATPTQAAPPHGSPADASTPRPPLKPRANRAPESRTP